MFYSNNLSTAAKGARKKIHGGSGVSGNGDAYSPGSKYTFVFIFMFGYALKHNYDIDSLSFYSCGLPRVSQRMFVRLIIFPACRSLC